MKLKFFVFFLILLSCNISFSQNRSSVIFAKLVYDKKEINGDHVTISWKFLKGKYPSKYKVYKKGLKDKSFSQILPKQYYTMNKNVPRYIFIDSILNGEKYARYYMTPLDSLGKAGTNTDTITVSLFDMRTITIPEKIKTEVIKKNGSVKLNWHVPSKEMVNRVAIYRSIYYDSLYTKIADLPVADTTYIDTKVKSMERYYYYLTSQGVLGESSYPSIKVFAIPNDTLRPDRPLGFRCQPFNKGVKLFWNSDDNFVRGYYIYRGKGKGLPMEMISGYLEKSDSATVYIDSSNAITGNKTYTYAVQAESYSYIKSKFSDTLLVRPGKPTMPQQPFDITTYAGDSTIKVRWKDMTKLEDNILGYNVYRRIAETSDKLLCITSKPVSASKNYFVDATAKKGVTYEYVVESIDIFKGKSKMSEIATGIIEAVISVSPKGLKYYPSAKGITLEWNEVLSQSIAGYKIYQYLENETPKLIATVDKVNNTYEITTLTKGKLNFFYVTAYSKEGKESVASSVVTYMK